jgi:hypothetical protein
VVKGHIKLICRQWTGHNVPTSLNVAAFKINVFVPVFLILDTISMGIGLWFYFTGLAGYDNFRIKNHGKSLCRK